MNRTLHAAALMGVTLTLAALTGCQAGTDAATSTDYDPADGRNINVPLDAAYPDPYLAIRNAVVVSEGGAAALVVTVVNNTGDAEVLESATLNGEPVISPAGPIDLPPGAVVNVSSDEGVEAGVPALEASPGDWVDLTLAFTRAGDTDLDVLVVPPGDQYVPDLEADVIDRFETALAALQAAEAAAQNDTQQQNETKQKNQGSNN